LVESFVVQTAIPTWGSVVKTFRGPKEFLLSLAEDSARRFIAFQRGAITESELRHSIIQDVIRYSDFDASLELVRTSPDWFHGGFLALLRELASAGYVYNKRWCLEDTRSQAELDEQAKLHRPFLQLAIPAMISER